MKDLKLWLSISNLRNVPDTLLIYSRIADYSDDLFEIGEDEDEFEVLRRVSLAPKHSLYRLKVRSISWRK